MVIVWDLDAPKEYHYGQFSKEVGEGSLVYLHNFIDVEEQIAKDESNALIVVTTEKKFSFSAQLNKLVTQLPVLIFTEADKKAKAILALIVNHLSLTQKAENESEDESSSINWSESLDYIHENLTNNEFSLEDAANHSYVCKWYYSKLFKKQFGVTFRDYLIHNRIERAKQLIMADNSITDVCYMVGYGDLTHFGRIFQKKVGMTPSMYKRKVNMKKAI
ncbi:AraC family transcriptional regulator [Fictibacillus enclensis]|uniref:helix-turn-helix transcriptional regulator n=1 Tax=Fictibacillus enclensis TaxID=1017270 RepID=UPI0025A2353A|nr:AraC family transcriptional regulator [Fictibacillus enclensis]MDM5335838.1 AraC family transcriptional regulator [Fictibacillus enclensis]